MTLYSDTHTHTHTQVQSWNIFARIWYVVYRTIAEAYEEINSF